MSRTKKRAKPKPYSCESKPAHKEHERWYRMCVKKCMWKEDYDAILPKRGTCGWLTW